MEATSSLLRGLQIDSLIDHSSNAREVLCFRLSGGAKLLVDLLTQQYEDILHNRKLNQTSSTSQADQSLHTFLKLLAICHSYCRNYDFSADLAIFGGHMFLKKILMSNSTPSDIVDAVENVIGSITLSGCMFPLKGVISLGNIENIVRPTKCEFMKVPRYTSLLNGSKFSESDDERDHQKFVVHLRSIPLSVYGTGQHAVGYLLWSSAVILSRFLVQNEQLLICNKIVLECGAGLGLCGIVAGRFASEVTLSDFNEILVENLQYNICELLVYFCTVFR